MPATERIDESASPAWQTEAIEPGTDLLAGYEWFEHLRAERSGFFGAIGHDLCRFRFGRLRKYAYAFLGAAAGASATGAVIPVLVGFVGFVAGRTALSLLRVRRSSLTREAAGEWCAESAQALVPVNLHAQETGLVKRLLRLDALSDPEGCRTVWIHHAWRLVRIIHGYNLRLAVLHSVLAAKDFAPSRQNAAAKAMAELLRQYRSRIIWIQYSLKEAYDDGEGSLAGLRARNEALESSDLFGDKVPESAEAADGAAPPLDWLILEPPILLRGQILQQYAKDIATIADYGEVPITVVDAKISRLQDQMPFQEAGPAAPAQRSGTDGKTGSDD